MFVINAGRAAVAVVAVVVDSSADFCCCCSFSSCALTLTFHQIRANSNLFCLCVLRTLLFPVYFLSLPLLHRRTWQITKSIRLTATIRPIQNFRIQHKHEKYKLELGEGKERRKNAFIPLIQLRPHANMSWRHDSFEQL